MTNFSDLSDQARLDFEADLDFAIDLAATPVRRGTRPVSVADLYRYARDPQFGRNGDVRRAIVTDPRINSYWASILAHYNGFQLELAAAAAGQDERILLTDERSGRRVEFTRSSSEPGLGILIVHLGETAGPPPTRLSVWTNSGSMELDLPLPHKGICQLDLDYDGDAASLFKDASVKLEIW